MLSSPQNMLFYVFFFFKQIMNNKAYFPLSSNFAYMTSRKKSRGINYSVHEMENNDTSGNNESALLYVTCNDICHSTKVQLN